MEQLNKVELRGIVGNARVQSIGETQMIRFSVATDYIHKNNGGDVIVETTWHQVVAFKNDKMPDFDKITRGTGVEVTGRLRNNRFTNSDGVEITSTEILASKIELYGLD